MQVVLGKRPREIHIIPRNQLRAVFHLSHQRFGKLQALRIVALVVIDVHVKTAQNRVVRLSLRHLRYQFQGFVLIAAEVQQRRITRQILHIRSLDVHVFRKSVRRFGKLFVLVIYVGQLPVGDRIFRIHLDQLVQHIDRILRIGTAVNLGVFEISLLAFVIEIDSLLVAARRIAVLLFSGQDVSFENENIRRFRSDGARLLHVFHRLGGRNRQISPCNRNVNGGILLILTGQKTAESLVGIRVVRQVEFQFADRIQYVIGIGHDPFLIVISRRILHVLGRIELAQVIAHFGLVRLSALQIRQQLLFGFAVHAYLVVIDRFSIIFCEKRSRPHHQSEGQNTNFRTHF